jgi:hypothetical protein
MTEAKGPLLLPHERWFANAGFLNKEAPEGSPKWRTLQQLGPKGVALLMAFFADFVLGWLLVIVTFILDFASGGKGTLRHITLYVLLAGILIIIFSVIRRVQSSSAGRKFRSAQEPAGPS